MDAFWPPPPTITTTTPTVSTLELPVQKGSQTRRKILFYLQLQNCCLWSCSDLSSRRAFQPRVDPIIYIFLFGIPLPRCVLSRCQGDAHQTRLHWPVLGWGGGGYEGSVFVSAGGDSAFLKAPAKFKRMQFHRSGPKDQSPSTRRWPPHAESSFQMSLTHVEAVSGAQN